MMIFSLGLLPLALLDLPAFAGARLEKLL